MIDGWEAALYQVIDWLETAAIVIDKNIEYLSRVATTTWKFDLDFEFCGFQLPGITVKGEKGNQISNILRSPTEHNCRFYVLVLS